MTLDDLEPAVRPNDTLYEAVTRLATRASNGQLALLLVAGSSAGVALALRAPHFWPVVGACCTVVAIAAWGLIEHVQRAHPTRLAKAAEWSLVAFGSIGAALFAMGALYAMLGSGWIS